MPWSFNGLYCCRGRKRTGITIGVFRLIVSLCMIGLPIKAVIAGVDIIKNSNIPQKIRSEEIVKVAVYSLVILTYLVDSIVSIILIIGITIKNRAFLFIWLIASLVTTLVSTLISLLSDLPVIGSIILVNSGFMVFFYLYILSLYVHMPLLTNNQSSYGSC